MQYACRTILFVSALLLCNYWLEFNETLWKPSILRGDAHIVALFWSDTSTHSYGPWLVMQYAYRAIIVSVLLLCNYWLEFNNTSWESSISREDAHIIGLFQSDPLTQSYGPWLVMRYAYRAKIVFALLLCNYWLEFEETLWEPSIPREDAYIAALFWSDTVTQSYGHWLVMQYANRAIIVSALQNVLLCNYLLEFNKTLWESSISRGDVHIVCLFRSDSLTQEFWPLISYAVCI
jgi:glycerol-3-phosphate cytidylyltransferase-like family protein